MRTVSFEEWLDWLLTTRVTEKDGTFTRFDLVQAVAAELPAGTPITVVESTVSRALASPTIVQVGDHWTERRPVDAPDRIVGDDRELRYTSRSLLAIEQQLLVQLTAGAPAPIGRLDPVAVAAAIEASTLGDDQATAIRALYLAATAVQDARRDWIIANWPHLVELEQVTQLVATQEPLAHWPTAQPDEVRDVLDQLRRLAPPSTPARNDPSPNSTDKRPTAIPCAASRPAATTSASSPPGWRRPPNTKPSSTS